MLLIGDEGSPTDDEPVLWSIHGTGAGFQATTFAIGSTPAGFVSGVPLAEPIVSSESYVVSVRFEESDALRLRRSFNLEELNSHSWLVPRGRYVSDQGFDAVEIDCDGV